MSKTFAIFKSNSELAQKTSFEITNRLINLGFVIDEENPNYVISIGGDGTFLRAIQKYKDYKTTFANINCGNFGYLCEFDSFEVDQLIEAISEGNERKELSLLEGIYNENRFYALNEFRVESSEGDTIVFDVYIDNIYLETLRGDGCCISSTTGSTGIARSLGGPIIDHKLEVVEFIEKAPVQNRTYQSIRTPLVLSKETEITVTNFRNNKFALHYDSNTFKVEDENAEFTFRYSDKTIEVIKNKNNKYVSKTREAFIYESNWWNYTT